jgi:hypothetical protein
LDLDVFSLLEKLRLRISGYTGKVLSYDGGEDLVNLLSNLPDLRLETVVLQERIIDFEFYRTTFGFGLDCADLV